MTDYKSKYLGNTDGLGTWTKDEINCYLPILENLDPETLLKLHELCEIKMFAPGQWVDEEQAVWVLMSPYDTPKELLMEAFDKLKLI